MGRLNSTTNGQILARSQRRAHIGDRVQVLFLVTAFDGMVAFLPPSASSRNLSAAQSSGMLAHLGLARVPLYFTVACAFLSVPLYRDLVVRRHPAGLEGYSSGPPAGCWRCAPSARSSWAWRCAPLQSASICGCRFVLLVASEWSWSRPENAWLISCSVPAQNQFR
jgi:hypothetical protein